MRKVGQPLRLISTGGRKPDGALLRRHGAATVAAVAALIAAVTAVVGCRAVPTPLRGPGAFEAQARANITAGLDLYESGEFVLAARRFRAASTQARAGGVRALEKKSVVGECTAWLRARRLGELGECSERLERLQRRERRSEPGVNTLIALGAIAGQRPAPALRIPNTVQPLFRQAVEESQ